MKSYNEYIYKGSICWFYMNEFSELEDRIKFSKQNRNCGFSIEHEFLLEARFQSCHNILEETEMLIEGLMCWRKNLQHYLIQN